MDATMSASVEILPDEVLEEVFSYCSYRDLVQSVQNVSTRWRLVSHTTRLWEDLVYCPNKRESDPQIVRMLNMSAKLRIVDLHERTCGEEVFRVLTENCPDLKKLVFTGSQNLSCNLLRDLQEKCPKIEHFTISGIILTSPEKCEILGSFNDLKTLVTEWNGFSCISLKPIVDGCLKLEHLEMGYTSFEMEEFRYLLLKMKDRLHTLHVSCCNTDKHPFHCTIPSLSVCTALKSLFIESNCEGMFKSIVKALGSIKTLTTLTWRDLYVDNVSMYTSLFDNRNMAQLIKLVIYSCFNYNDAVTKSIVENCPLLQSIELNVCEEYTDESLKMFPTLKELKSVSLYGNDNITDSGVAYLQQIQKLKYLSLGGCSTLSKASLELITNFSKLQVLVFPCQDLTGLPVDLIASRMKQLNLLETYRCRNVDVLALERLQSQVSRIRLCIDEISREWARLVSLGQFDSLPW